MFAGGLMSSILGGSSTFGDGGTEGLSSSSLPSSLISSKAFLESIEPLLLFDSRLSLSGDWGFSYGFSGIGDGLSGYFLI